MLLIPFSHKFAARLGLVTCLACLLVLTGCHSSKRAARNDTEIDVSTGASTQVDSDSRVETRKSKKKEKAKKQEQSTVDHVNANRQSARGIRGRMNINLKAGSSPLTASGTIKMKRDEIIQLSITALGLVELGRMEMTPEYLFVQDRYHKRYLKAAWSEIPTLKSAGIDFTAFQALFWNELFLPGSTNFPTEKDFELSEIGKLIRLSPKQGTPLADALFYATKDGKLLQQTSLVAKNGKSRFDGTCQAWSELDSKQFPSALRLIITNNGRQFTADLTFSRMQVDESMGDLSTSVSDDRYTRVSLEEVLKGLHL